MRRRHCCLAILLACTGAAAQARPGSCPGRAHVPMVKWDGVRPGVHVLVNGKGPYLFLIDTGAGGLARADTSLVERLPLPRVGSAPRSDGSAAAAAAGARMDTYALASIRLGTLERRDVEAGGRRYSAPGSRTPFDGILGYGFFAGCVLTLDYAKGEVIVGPGPLPLGPGTVSYRSDEGGPQVPLRVAGRRMIANLDTGDRDGFTLPPAKLAGLRLRAPLRTTGTGHSANQDFAIREAPLEGTVRVGAVAWKDPVIAVVEAFDNVNIGSAALQDVRIAFDPDRKRVRLSGRRR